MVKKAMAKIKYIRVSTTHQKGGIERQKQNIEEEGFDKVFIDETSGKDTNRPAFQKMMDYVREGDIIYFESFSRFSRSLPDLLNTIEILNKKGVEFVSEKENISTSGPAGKLVIAVFGAVAQYEREINEERRAYGYNKALEEGTVGRPKSEVTDSFKAAVLDWRNKKITATEAIKRCGVPRTTFYRMVKENNL